MSRPNSPRKRQASLYRKRPQERPSGRDIHRCQAALKNERLAPVLSEDGDDAHVEVLRLLTERREDLVAERTRALNRLHVLLRDLLSDTVSSSSSPPM